MRIFAVLQYLLTVQRVIFSQHISCMVDVFDAVDGSQKLEGFLIISIIDLF